MKNTEYIKSPLNYVGSKFKLLPQILPLFPKNINKFVDLFAGGCNVSINVSAKEYFINDIINYLITLYQEFYSHDYEYLLEYINNKIDIFKLSKDNKEGFLSFREYYNKNRNPLDLFVLICYSFNYQIRFNNKHHYNSSFGWKTSSFNDKIKQNLELFVNELQKRDINFSSYNFLDFDFSQFTSNDFIYCDPPYLITTVSYCDGKRGFTGWNESLEIQLLDLLDKLNNRGINFALSNVFTHNGKTNSILIEWSKNYKIHNINSIYNKYNHHKQKVLDDTIEVLITNY